MKICVWSDLHLEFQPSLPSLPEADVLVLAGDILVARHLKARELPEDHPQHLYLKWFHEASLQYKQVLWTAGNHEFYGSSIQETLELCGKFAEQFKNVWFLEKQVAEVEGQRFLGTTLWTNCNNLDPRTMLVLQYGLNDYRKITQNNYSKLFPRHTAQMHLESMQWLRNTAQPGDVIITHHAPSKKSIPPQYKSDYDLNGGYASSLEEDILELQPRVWIHGHTHHPNSYTLGATNIVCNPHGYPSELQPQPLTLLL